MHISATHHQGYRDVNMAQTHPKSLKQYQLQTYSKNKNKDLQKYQERPYNWRPRKLSSLRMLSCSCSSGWPFKYKRSNVNKQTWTLIVLSDTHFLALVLRICIQITSFQISSTLPHYLQHLSSPTNTWGLLHEIAMSKHLPPSEDRTWRPNLFLDKGTPYYPKKWHDPGWASLVTWCLSVCLFQNHWQDSEETKFRMASKNPETMLMCFWALTWNGNFLFFSQS